MSVQVLLDKIRVAVLPPPGDGISLLSASTTVMSVSAVYLYFAGYIFSYFYYRAFGVAVEALDLPPQYYFVHSYSVFDTGPGALSFSILILIVSAYSIGKLRRGLLLLSLIGAFPALFSVSHQSAQNASYLMRRKPNATVNFKFKDATGKKLSEAGTIESPAPPGCGQTVPGMEGQYALLLDAKDRVIVFCQPRSSILPNENPPASVYTVLRSDLLWSEIISN